MEPFVYPECRICVDKSSHNYGWIYIKSADGTWIAAGTTSDKVVKVAVEATKDSKASTTYYHYGVYHPYDSSV